MKKKKDNSENKRAYPFPNLVDDCPAEPKRVRHTHPAVNYIENYSPGCDEAKKYLEDAGFEVKDIIRTFIARIPFVSSADCPIKGSLRDIEEAWREKANVETYDDEYYLLDPETAKKRNIQPPARFWAGEVFMATITVEGTEMNMMFTETEQAKILLEQCARKEYKLPIEIEGHDDPYVHVGVSLVTQRVSDKLSTQFRHWGTVVESPLQWLEKFGVQYARSKGKTPYVKGFISGREALEFEKQAKNSKTLKQIMQVRKKLDEKQMGEKQETTT